MLGLVVCPGMRCSCLGQISTTVSWPPDQVQEGTCCCDVLCFVWYKDNNLDNDVVDYQMLVHVLNNCPSPAVVIYGLQRSAQEGEKDFGSDVCHFTETDFYVDDAVI